MERAVGYHKLIILLMVVIISVVVCCKKESKTPLPAAEPNDSTIGTYIGSMHIHQAWAYGGAPTSTWDTSYADTIVLVKVGADSFHTGTKIFTSPTGYLKIDSSGVYPYYDGGIRDTLKVITAADSISYYYYTFAPYHGGTAGFSSYTKTFSGRR